jgi:hypothetical protein
MRWGVKLVAGLGRSPDHSGFERICSPKYAFHDIIDKGEIAEHFTMIINVAHPVGSSRTCHYSRLPHDFLVLFLHPSLLRYLTASLPVSDRSVDNEVRGSRRQR